MADNKEKMKKETKTCIPLHNAGISIVTRNRSVMENGRYLCDKYKLKLKRQKMNIMKGEREMNWTPWKQKQSFPLS